jgi:hypothetical protein
MHTETAMSEIDMEKKMAENIKAEVEDLPTAGNLIESSAEVTLSSCQSSVLSIF